jgi:enterochelin esterase-like enzyme
MNSGSTHLTTHSSSTPHTSRRSRWLRRFVIGLAVVTALSGVVAAWGYSQGWDRYIHYRHLPDWNRTHEKALLNQLLPTATARASLAATPQASLADASPALGSRKSADITASPSASPDTVLDYMHMHNGRVTHEHIQSAVLGKILDYRIYLPPGYDDRRMQHTRYPVVYLLHGAPGGEDDWVDGGSANQTADALIRSRTIHPIIIVMPDGCLGDPHHDTQWGNSPVTGERVEDAIIHDLIPAIDATYRTIPNRDARAIGGLSSGGYGAVNITLHHPDMFVSVFSLSGYFRWEKTYDGKDIWGSDDARRLNSPEEIVQPLSQPVHMDIIEGLDEGSGIDDTHAFDAKLTQAGIDHETHFFDGGHSWDFWKAHLLDALEYTDRYLTAAHR